MLDIELSFFVASQWVSLYAQRVCCVNHQGLLRINHTVAKKDGVHLFKGRIRVSHVQECLEESRRRRKERAAPNPEHCRAARASTSGRGGSSTRALRKSERGNGRHGADAGLAGANTDAEDGREAEAEPVDEGPSGSEAEGSGGAPKVIYYNLATREIRFRRPTEPKLLVDGNLSWRLIEGSGTRVMPICSAVAAGAALALLGGHVVECCEPSIVVYCSRLNHRKA
jgi:hypothetical protein